MKYMEKLMKLVSTELGCLYVAGNADIDAGEFELMNDVVGELVIFSDEDPQLVGVPLSLEEALEANKYVWATLYPVANPVQVNKRKFRSWSRANLTRRVETEHNVTYEPIRAYRHSMLSIDSGDEMPVLVDANASWPMGNQLVLGEPTRTLKLKRPL